MLHRVRGKSPLSRPPHFVAQFLRANAPRIDEEVAKVNPDLVVHDRNGEIYSVRYEAVNAMLLTSS